MGDICLTDISKSFGENRVLTGFSGVFPAGKITCVTGPSGRGKTTLLRLIAGLETPDSGRITGVDGQKIGMVFQEDRLIGSLRASDNVRLVMAKAVTEAHLRQCFAALGLEESFDKPANALSGGMARRTALLRALLSDADLLLLDEPFKGLDEDTRQRVIAFTREELRGRTCILVTHAAEEAELLGAAAHIRLTDAGHAG